MSLRKRASTSHLLWLHFLSSNVSPGYHSRFCLVRRVNDLLLKTLTQKPKWRAPKSSLITIRWKINQRNGAIDFTSVRVLACHRCGNRVGSGIGQLCTPRWVPETKCLEAMSTVVSPRKQWLKNSLNILRTPKCVR